ncbi:MAG: hypothetical protein JXM70_24360 [Pirellulales bacterium]|nr:hypothetical protein [Pirellulales bacterium]
MEELKILLNLALSPLGIGGIVTTVVLSGMIGIWIFRPVDRAAKDREHPMQFTIVDFLCLFFIIQLAMAIIHWQLGVGYGAQMWSVHLFDIFAVFACGTLWMKSVQFMSRAGIQRPAHRVLFLAVIIPGTLAVVMTIPIMLAFRIETILTKPTTENNIRPAALLAMLVILAAMPLVLYFLARLTRMIVAAAEPPQRALVEVELVEQVENS